MDSTRVYTKRILDDLKVASAFFADVEFVWKDQKIPTSSLILAALSGMMSTALKDLVYENIDDRIQIIVPDSEIDFGLVSSLFRNILFSPDEDLELDEKYHEVLDYLDIKSTGFNTHATVGLCCQLILFSTFDNLFHTFLMQQGLQKSILKKFDGQIGCPILLVAIEAIVIFPLLAYHFMQFTHKVGMKNIFKCWKTFSVIS